MKRILVVTKDLQVHGITKVVLNYFNNNTITDISYDFAAGSPIDDNVRKLICNKGGRIFAIKNKNASKLLYYFGLAKVMSQNKYEILHVHGNSTLIAIELLLGKIFGIKKRVAHCHNTSCEHVALHKCLYPVFVKMYTIGLACSEEAGVWMFGARPFTILKNGIDIEKFRFSQSFRESVRTRLAYSENDYVIGHVGLFNEQKNHSFLIAVFNKMLENDRNLKLLLVGEGPLKNEIQNQVKKLGISENVFFYGTTDNISEILSAVDSFAFPSLFEGLGIALIEAQVSGLPCYVSDRVPRQAKVTDHIEFLPIDTNEDVKKWAESILKKVKYEDRFNAIDVLSVPVKNYDIKSESSRLMAIYKELL